MNKIKAIFFDLGNVIVNFDIAILERGYASHGYRPDGKMIEYIMKSDIGTKYMRGKISSSQFFMRTKRVLKMDIDFKEFFRIWNSMFYPSPEVEGLIRKIKEKNPGIIFILVSDTNEAHYDFIESKYDILALMDHTVLSHRVGRLKPHPDVYRKAIRLSGKLAREIFYADDREDLIKAARAMGLHAFQFTGCEGLKCRLEKLGVLV